MSSPIDPSLPREPSRLQPSPTAPAERPPEQLQLEQGQFPVLARGELQGTHGRLSVEWVQGDETTLADLSRAYSPAMAGAIARGLGLSPTVERPLTHYEVEQAREMVQNAASPLAGVDFAQQLRARHSGSSGPQT